MKKKMADNSKTENIDEFISDFSRFYILTILYEGPAHCLLYTSDAADE